MAQLTQWQQRFIEELGRVPRKQGWCVDSERCIYRKSRVNDVTILDCPIVAIAKHCNPAEFYTSDEVGDAGMAIGLKESQIDSVVMAADGSAKVKYRPFRKAMLAILGLEEVKHA